MCVCPAVCVRLCLCPCTTAAGAIFERPSMRARPLPLLKGRGAIRKPSNAPRLHCRKITNRAGRLEHCDNNAEQIDCGAADCAASIRCVHPCAHGLCVHGTAIGIRRLHDVQTRYFFHTGNSHPLEWVQPSTSADTGSYSAQHRSRRWATPTCKKGSHARGELYTQESERAREGERARGGTGEREGERECLTRARARALSLSVKPYTLNPLQHSPPLPLSLSLSIPLYLSLLACVYVPESMCVPLSLCLSVTCVCL